MCDLDTVAQSAFEFADQNKDGTIDVQEAGHIISFIIEKGLFSLETLGLDGLDLDLDTVGPLAFEYADQNKDGTIDAQEAALVLDFIMENIGNIELPDY